MIHVDADMYDPEPEDQPRPKHAPGSCFDKHCSCEAIADAEAEATSEDFAKGLASSCKTC